jgi:hypothetical protein
MTPPLQAEEGGATNLKRTNLGNDSRHPFTLRLGRQTGFHHLFALPASLIDPGHRPGPPVKHALGLPTTDKHYPLWASGSCSLRCLARRDVAIGTHVLLTVCTRVQNLSRDIAAKPRVHA